MFAPMYASFNNKCKKIMKITFFEVKKTSFTSKHLWFFLISIIVGILVSYQYQSYQKVIALSTSRDSTTSFFEELHILLRTNQNLKEEIEALTEKNNKYSDQTQAAEFLSKEIEKTQKLAGYTNIRGAGVSIVIDKPIQLVWCVDLVNEFFAVGAETVSINGIRLVDTTIGFHASLGDQIIVNAVPLTPPYRFEAIGDAQNLMRILSQTGGIIQRIRLAYPNHSVEIEKKDIIEMQKVM